MKIAIIGSGISGNVLAYHLYKEHDISVFEANNYIGGHSHTHNIDVNGQQYKIDTGFIVFNGKTYPNFIALLNELNVTSQQSTMSFSVKCELSGLEYNGSNINTLFAQRSNLLKPSFYKMLADILRFNREAPDILNKPENILSLGFYLKKNNYSQQFIDQYIIPMGSAIWSSSYDQMLDFPAQFFIRFFINHGLLNIKNRPPWFVIKGGSNAYVKKLINGFQDKIRLNSPVKKVNRYENHVEIICENRLPEKFDYVFFACHSDEALAVLNNPKPFEENILSAFPYQKNDVVLHTDTTLLPKRKLAWASWNYHRLNNKDKPVALTYNMNILQGISCKETFCVTLNNSNAINETKILKRLQYSHPLFTYRSIHAQSQHHRLNGTNRCFYAGAYWRYGFHEDGVVSALEALKHFKEKTGYEQQDLLRAS